jgi:hypothetical protein
MSETTRNKVPIRVILLTWLIAGTMDITAAIIQTYIKFGKGPQGMFRFIASGVFGRKGATGGFPMEVAGLVFHYLIALIWTLLFFWIYPKWPLLSKNKVITGIAYGAFVWTIMNEVVLPLSNAPHLPFVLKKAAIAMGILMVCIGLPISLIAGSYYDKKDGKANDFLKNL